MNILSITLAAKIGVSAIALVIPFLFLPQASLERLAKMSFPSIHFARLYGMAILALLVAYGFGFHDAWQGQFPASAVAMGIVSNLGASIVLFASGAWRTSKPLSFFFASIGLLLLWSWFFPSAALS